MGRRERKSQPSHTCLTNLFMNIHVQLLSTLVFCSIAFCLDNSCSEGRPHRNPVSPFPMNMIWTLPAKCQVPWISTVDMMMPQWQPTDGCSHNRGETKGGGDAKGLGGARLLLHFSSSPGFKYCSDNLFQGILGNKGSRFGWAGWWVMSQHNGLITLPHFFHSDKNEPWPQLLGSGSHATWIGYMMGVNKPKREKVRWAQSWHSTPPLVIHRATSAQHCSYKASLNGTSVPPSTTTVMHFKPNSTTWTLQSGATAAPPLTSPQEWGGRSQRAAHIE